MFISDTDKRLYAFFLIAGFILFTFTDSRALLIGNSCAFIFLLHKEAHKTMKYFLIAFSCFVYLSFFYKENSTYGRILIYKISFRVIQNEWPWGGGTSSFKRNYLLEQAEYFEQNKHTAKELLLADNTIFAFNDYLQLISEYGLIAVIVLFLFAYVLIKTIRFSYDKPLAKLSIFLIITLSVAAFFTHIFEKNLNLYLFSISLFYCFTIILKMSRSKTFFLLFVISSLFAQKSYQNWRETNFLKHINYSIKTGEYMYVKEVLTKRHQVGNCKDECLFYLGKVNAILGENRTSIFYLESYIAANSKSHAYSMLGEAWDKLNEKKKAEEYYLTAINMVPNRFEERNKLFNLYLSQSKKIKAIQVGKTLLELPVKIPTPRIEHIKKTVTEEIERLKMDCHN